MSKQRLMLSIATFGCIFVLTLLGVTWFVLTMARGILTIVQPAS